MTMSRFFLGGEGSCSSGGQAAVIQVSAHKRDGHDATKHLSHGKGPDGAKRGGMGMAVGAFGFFSR